MDIVPNNREEINIFYFEHEEHIQIKISKNLETFLFTNMGEKYLVEMNGANLM